MRPVNDGGVTGSVVVDTSQSEGARLRPVAISAVTLEGGLWQARCEANRVAGLPRLHDRLEAHGVVDNFRRKVGNGSERRGLWFTDSDLYKWMEGAAWSLASNADADLEARLNDAVEAVVAAQDADGYVNTNFEPDGRFPDLAWSHELYCAGHLFQAAVALHRTTGRRDLLDASTRFADFLGREFGPGGRDDRDRHPGVETALVELARSTGRNHDVDLARTLLDRVPHSSWDHLSGHAVCALYFECGLADVAIESGEPAIAEELATRWRDLVDTRSYVTGGVGGRWVGESVGRPYELPVESAYAETCSTIAAAHWAWRMLALTGEVEYADHLEWVLHNGVLAGVSLGCDEWFYANPLVFAPDEEQNPFIGDTLPLEIAGPLPLRRREWRDVTCCPTNVVRLLASLPGYVCSTDDSGALWLHLYAACTVSTGGWRLRIETDMPWDGRVEITVDAAPAGESALRLRIPGWSHAPTLDGHPVASGAYAVVSRVWTAGERVLLNLGVVVDLLESHPHVVGSRGSVAIRRGPLVYCLEGADQPDIDVLAAALDTSAPLTATHVVALLGGVTVLRGRGRVPVESGGPLYRPVGIGTSEREVALTAIPYHAWANRGLWRMALWLPRAGAGAG